MDFVIGGGASNDIDDLCGDGGEKVNVDITWRGKGKSNDIDGSIGVKVNGW